jgi:hypothetical protein
MTTICAQLMAIVIPCATSTKKSIAPIVAMIIHMSTCALMVRLRWLLS